MTTPTPTLRGSERGSEPDREPGPVRLLARLFLTQLLVVIAVAAVIATVFTLTGRGTGPDVAATDTSGSSTPDPASRSASATASTSAPATTAPASPTMSTSAPPSSSSAAGSAKIDVLNQSVPSGSAQKVAAQLHDAGWTIGRVGDFHGNVSTSTVYWLSTDQRRQARQIARNLGGLRVLQGFSTLNASRVTVILVDKL
jgi:cytoskeletal protein RodZ